MKKASPELINQIKDELVEDLSRYDGDYDEWCEVVFDCPSNTLEDLLSQVPDEDSPRVSKMMYKFIETLGG